MKIFVSYSQRDGVVTRPMLELLDKHLREVCVPFIHCLHGSNRRWEQLHVLKALFNSQTVLLIDSGKFGQKALSKLGSVSEVDIVVTDAEPSAEDRKMLEGAGCRIIVAA